MFYRPWLTMQLPAALVDQRTLPVVLKHDETCNPPSEMLEILDDPLPMVAQTAGCDFDFECGQGVSVHYIYEGGVRTL